MAEHGAHITATEQTQPSIFEVVASDSLNSSFNPAIKRLCNVSKHEHYQNIKNKQSIHWFQLGTLSKALFIVTVKVAISNLNCDVLNCLLNESKRLIFIFIFLFLFLAIGLNKSRKI